MMDRALQLQRFLVSNSLAHTVENIRNCLLRQNQGRFQGHCGRILITKAPKSKFQHHQRMHNFESLGPLMSMPKRVTSRIARVSNGACVPQRNRLCYGRTDVFQRRWDLLEDQCHSQQVLGRIQRNSSSESGSLSHRRDGKLLESNSFKESTNAKGKTTERMRGLLRGRRSLSATDRITRILAADTSSPGSSEGPGLGEDIPPLVNARASSDGGESQPSLYSKTAPVGSLRGLEGGEGQGGDSLPQDPPMVDGEMVLAIKENFKRHEYLYRMFPLNASRTFHSKYGAISHADIVGHLAGRTFCTDLGIDVMIRRPSLDEFVVHMRRTPVISYPKDCCTMLMMADIGPGDVILEAGSGSGAMTLFLSRAVGPAGCVHSFEAKPEHLERAVRNVRQWAASWNLGHHPRLHWPNNVCFHSGKLQECDRELDAALRVDAAVIDMEMPNSALPTLAAKLKSGRAAVMYIANLTQVIEVVEYLRIHRLPLTVENTLEVTHKKWVVNPARRHSGRALEEARLSADSEMQPDENDPEYGRDSSSTQYIEDNVPKYIARPHNRQHGHTAFLVKIRKIGSASTAYKL